MVLAIPCAFAQRDERADAFAQMAILACHQRVARGAKLFGLAQHRCQYAIFINFELGHSRYPAWRSSFQRLAL